VTADVVAQDLLGMALRIKIGGIDEVAAELDESIDDLLGLLHGRAPAKILAKRHRAETKRAHAQSGVPESHVVVELHAAILPWVASLARPISQAVGRNFTASSYYNAPPPLRTLPDDCTGIYRLAYLVRKRHA
jgi:hypothetical protein